MSDVGKVFIGGLPKGCTQESLAQWATQFGPCTKAEVRVDAWGTPRGFGFIIFEDPNDAQKVLDNHANNQIEGKWVDCKPPTPPGGKGDAMPSGGKGGGGKAGPGFGGGAGAGGYDHLNPPSKIFVGALPKTATEDSVIAHFSQYGPVKECLLKKHEDGLCKGYAFITFEEVSAAKMVLDTYDSNEFEGKWIDCKPATSSPGDSKGGKGKGKDMGKGGKGPSGPSFDSWGGGAPAPQSFGGGYGKGCGGGYGADPWGGCGGGCAGAWGGCGGGYGGGYGGDAWGGYGKGAPAFGGYGGPPAGGAMGAYGAAPRPAYGKGGKGVGPYW